MINIENFNEMDRRIDQADVRELLEIRRNALREAARVEERLLAAVDKGSIDWIEDEAFIYSKQMEWIAKCCARLATIYGEMEEGL